MIQRQYIGLIAAIAAAHLESEINRRATVLPDQQPLPEKESQILHLGEVFGASLTLDGARRVTHVERSGGTYTDAPKGHRESYWVDVWILRPDGDTRIIRSQTELTEAVATKLHDDTTRLIGAFLFINRDVQLQAPHDCFVKGASDRSLARVRTHRYVPTPNNMATVIKPSGERIEVKNLAWLIQHQSQVRLIEVSPQSHFEKPRKGFESRMIATLADGTRFITDFASREVCKQWVEARETFKRAMCSDRWGWCDFWIHKETLK